LYRHCLDANGIPRVTIGGRLYTASRAAAWLYLGAELDDKTIMVSRIRECGVKTCVAWEHLRLVKLAPIVELRRRAA
jgi:hypothetical protein